MKTSWRLLRRQHGFRRVVTAGLVSLTGDWVLKIGLTYLVYALTGSTMAAGVAMLAAYLPYVLLGSVAGVLVDRWDRRRTMVCVDLLQAATLLPLLLVRHGRIWPAYVVVLVQGLLEPFFLPAEQALVPNLVEADELLTANALTGQTRNLARLVGAFGGGVLVAAGGIRAVMAFDAVTFLVSAALVAGVRVPVAPVEAAAEAGAAVRRLAREWRDGLRLMVTERGLRTVLLVLLVTGVGEGIMGTLMAPWVRDVVHGDGRAFGLILGVQAVGGIAGGFVAASLGTRYPARAMAGWGAVVFGCLDLALFTYPLLWPHVGPAVVLMVLVGVPAAVAVAGLMTVLQTLTEDRYRGRVFGALNVVQAASALAGIGLAAWLGDTVGITPVIAWQGAGYVLGGLIVLSGLRDHSWPAAVSRTSTPIVASASLSRSDSV